VAHPVQADQKRQLLAHLVKSNDWRQVLVFRPDQAWREPARPAAHARRDRSGCHPWQQGAERPHPHAGAIQAGSLRVLVATDIAARGLDIEALPHVVNYDMPHVAEDYVHRIGRTGRAGVEGEAVSLVSPEERPLLAAIERLMNRKVESRTVTGFQAGGSRPAPAHKPHHRPAPCRSNQGSLLAQLRHAVPYPLRGDLFLQRILPEALRERAESTLSRSWS